MIVNLKDDTVRIVEFLRSSAENDLKIPVSFDDAVNAILHSYFSLLGLHLGGDDDGGDE